MEDFFRSLAIGLGVLMGTFQQGIEPQWDVALHKKNVEVIAEAKLVRSVSPAMEEALVQGVPFSLTVRTRIDDSVTGISTKTLSYKVLTKSWTVESDAASVKTFDSAKEAQNAWLRWDDLRIGSVTKVPFTVSIEVSIGFPSRPDWKADMVWKTPTVVWKRSYLRVTEIPN